MEQCIARLDVAMFNAILPESDDEMTTDPVSDPISDPRVLPIPAGKSSFSAGAQLKNVIGSCSRWLTDLGILLDKEGGSTSLACLLGHCIDSTPDNSSVNSVFLIYEYVPNGNLRTHLSERSPEKVLKWSKRLAVLIGVAKAVHLLHAGVIPGFYKNRLKTNNILLDNHRIAKLSDYGLSIITEEIDKREARVEGQNSSVESRAWQMTKLEDDVYSLGFILFEALLGSSVSEREPSFLNEMSTSFSSQDGRKRIIDPVVLTISAQESLSIVISITSKCISSEPSSRPSIDDVLWNLQYAAKLQATADSDQRSDVTSQTYVGSPIHWSSTHLRNIFLPRLMKSEKSVEYPGTWSHETEKRLIVDHELARTGSKHSVKRKPTLATEDFGAGRFTLNIKRVNGLATIGTRIVQTLITKTVFDQNPVAIFAVSRVLLPKEIFGKEGAEESFNAASPP
ncbi:hypothetical protein MRB53_001780 [Persea americana]|uniref:Uncharacterized protein n=1 Tax=Persea americana TaxID=3435 RepID=A0ACC2MSM3_PERAE|nr:hypothetical protein MRB53_001780 [Persea americana]